MIARAAGFLLMLIVGSLLVVTPASATCSASVANVNFGTVNMLEAGAKNAMGTLSISCTGLSPSTEYLVCPAISTPRTLIRASGGSIDYELYSDTYGGNVWGSGASSAPGFQLTSNGSGAIVASLDIFASIGGAQSSAPTSSADSTYADTRLVDVSAGETATNSSCTQVGVQNHGSTTNLDITANYAPACTVAANALDFGSFATASTYHDASTTIDTRCSNGSQYSVQLDYGLSGVTPEERYMVNAGINTLKYGLYQDSTRSQPWGQTSTIDDVTGTGTGNTISFQVYGRVPGQVTPPAGTYSDVVAVTIVY